MSYSGAVPELVTLFRSEGELLVLPKDTLLDAQEINNKCYYVDKGYIATSLIGARPEASRNYVFAAGDICNLEAITGALPVRADVQLEAVSTAHLYCLSTQRLVEIAAARPKLSVELLKYASSQLRLYNYRIENLSYTYASDKIIYRLLYLAFRFGKRRGKKIIIAVPLTHRRLGSLINLRRESVSRELEKLAQKGLIECRRGMVVLPDIARLVQSFYEERRTDWSEVLALLDDELASVQQKDR